MYCRESCAECCSRTLNPPRTSRYPGRKEEQWWLVLGDTKANTLLAIKRVKLGRASNATLSFVAPAAVGPARLMLYFMCDSYMGADQEYEVRVPYKPIHCPSICDAVASVMSGVRSARDLVWVACGQPRFSCRSPSYAARNLQSSILM